MWTVHEVSALSGVSIRTLQYYDRIGLLPPSSRTGAGYRLYGKKDLERLRQILFFRELEFPLSAIRDILDSPDFDLGRALAQQLELLTLRKQHLEALIALARDLQKGETRQPMDFSAFDTSKIEALTEKARAEWGRTDAWKEYEKRSADRTTEETAGLGRALMDIFARMASVKDAGPASPQAQALVGELRSFISANYYTCTLPILRSLGQMYASGGEMTENIDRYAGEGTAAFAAEAIACCTQA